MPVRGCGASRIAGGVYIVVPTAPFGMPLEYFLIDPPRVVNPSEIGMSAQGMSFVPDMGGAGWGLGDWVGSGHYPNVTDILAEIRAHGLSRRIQSNANFGLLGPKSRIYLLHSRAHIEAGRNDLWQLMADAGAVRACPVPRPEHQIDGDMAARKLFLENTPMCARLWWEVIEGGQPIDSSRYGIRPLMDPFRGTMRDIGDVTYFGRRPPDGMELSYLPAFFASFPISHIEVVQDPVGGKHERSLAKASKAKLDVREVTE